MLHPEGQPRIVEPDLGLLRAAWWMPRNWRRPWRDKPGIFWCCCKSAPSSGPAMIQKCGCSVPTTVHVTFGADLPACPCLSGVTLALHYYAAGSVTPGQGTFGACNNLTDGWYGWFSALGTGDQFINCPSITPPGDPSFCLVLSCSGSHWILSIPGGAMGSSQAATTFTFTCSPLNIQFDGSTGNLLNVFTNGVSNCANSFIAATVTL